MTAATACPWDGLTPGTVSFCEERLCAWVAEPANAWSAFGYVAVALYLFATHARKARDARLYFVCFAAFLVGVGSFAFHATGSFAGEYLDLIGMFLLSALILAYAAGHSYGLTPKQTVGLYAGLVVGSALLLLVVKPIGIPLFSLQLVIGIGWEISRWRKAPPNEVARYRMLFGALGIFSVSFIIWVLDISRVVCSPTLHLISGHAIWHVLNALCMERLYRFYASFPAAEHAPAVTPSA